MHCNVLLMMRYKFCYSLFDNNCIFIFISMGYGEMTKSSVLTYRPDVDGLRAIAVMSVLLYHAFPTIFRSGYIGVDIFFVISGFLITTIIRKEVISGDFSLLSFYQKRIRRIYPALIITLIGILFLSWFLLSTDEYAVTLKHVIFSSVFTENFLLWSEDGYFDKA